ncbi:MAG: hypothetical protein ACI9CD_000436 [Candidatus Deianiraeaceae bacterium]|jgi:hypothetical protein
MNRCIKVPKIVIVVQGSAQYHNIVSQSFSEFPTVYSTWNDELSDRENVIFNKKPTITGKHNFFLQQKSTFSGLLFAKKMGATHALKIRSDMIFSDLTKLIDRMMNSSDLYFPAWHDWKGGYLMYFFQFGKIDDMVKLWNIKPTLIDCLYNNKRINKTLTKHFTHLCVPEKILTQSYFKHFGNRKVKYILPLMRELNIKCRWLKYKTNFEEFINDPLCDTTIHT